MWGKSTCVILEHKRIALTGKTRRNAVSLSRQHCSLWTFTTINTVISLFPPLISPVSHSVGLTNVPFWMFPNVIHRTFSSLHKTNTCTVLSTCRYIFRCGAVPRKLYTGLIQHCFATAVRTCQCRCFPWCVSMFMLTANHLWHAPPQLIRCEHVRTYATKNCAPCTAVATMLFCSVPYL